MTTLTNAPLLIETNEPMENFNPSPDDWCYCGNEKSFSTCCGSTNTTRTPPYGLFMFENYVDSETTRTLVEYAEQQQEGHRLMVIDSEKSTPDSIVKVEDKRRVAERVELGEWRQRVNELVKCIYTELAEKCFHRKMDWLESPDLVRYRKGGFYLSHADNQNRDSKDQLWKKVIDRDISLLIYLNNDFEGGELSFYRLNYQIRPRPGAVVLFPSDHRFLHQVEPVKKGARYAIVSWASVKGIKKIAQQAPQCAIHIN